MSKFAVKVGVDFELDKVDVEISVPENATDKGVSVVIEKTSKKEESKQSGFFKDWKVLAIVAIAMLVFSSGAYAAKFGDYVIFDKVLDAIVKVAGGALGK